MKQGLHAYDCKLGSGAEENHSGFSEDDTRKLELIINCPEPPAESLLAN